MKTLNLRGTHTALVTPFNKEAGIDFEKFKDLIEFQIAEGIEGIVVCGSTGESATLTHNEKIALITTAVETSNGRIPIIAGTGSNDTQSSLDLSVIAKEHGADALLIVTPYYNKPTQEGIYLHFRNIADNVDIPIILYNVPGRTATNVSPEIQVKLAQDCANIVATKEASGDLEQMMKIIKHAPKEFLLLSGDDALTLPIISIGGAGVISVISNYAPKMFGDLTRLALAGKYSEAKLILYKLLDLMELNFIESNPIPAKAALTIMGKIEEHVRMPLVPITRQSNNLIKKALKAAKLI